MDDVDLAGVDPARRAAIRKRVQVLRRHALIPEPTPEDERGFAAELGIRRQQFLNLAKAWKVHGQAGALPGATRRASAARPARMSSITEAAIEEAIGRMPNGSVAGIARLADEIAVGNGGARASWTAVAKRVEGARSSAAAAADEPRTIAVSRCATDMRVATTCGRNVPVVLALAVWAEDGSVLIADVGTADEPPSLAAAIARLCGMSRPGTASVRVRTFAPVATERKRLTRAVEGAGLSRSFDWPLPASAPSSTPQALLGSMLGPSRLSTFRRKAEWITPRHLEAALAKPVELAEIRLAVGELVTAHNRNVRSRELPGFSLGLPRERQALLRLLRDP